MMRRVWDWFIALLVILLTLMVVWAVAGRSLIDDVVTLVTAVVESNRPAVGVYPPCRDESDPGPCYWDADTMGNGTGLSFRVDEYGHVTYLDD